MATTYRGRGGRGPAQRGGRGRGGNKRPSHQVQQAPAAPAGPRAVEIPAAITVKDLSERMGLTPVDIIKALMKNGVLATINQELDYDTAAIVAGDMGWEVTEAPSVLAEIEEQEGAEAEAEDES